MILDEILEKKRLEVEISKQKMPLETLKELIKNLPPTRDFFGALTDSSGDFPGVRVIAEMKKASPSKGVLRPYFDPAEIAKQYSLGGAAAISVLTDKEYFQGSLDYLELAKEFGSIPVLRKDFIIDPYQVYESRAFGADALLLIVSVLHDERLKTLLELKHSLGMEALVEVHDEDEMGAALKSGCNIIGINNRNLKTFNVDTQVSVRLSKMVPKEKVVVCESGIGSRNIGEMILEGLNVFLIGETFMKAEDPQKELETLLRPFL